MADSNKLIIFDTTLRDGEQSPGASMTKDEKIRIARQLERLKVDVIEAGFAASSPGDFEAIKAIAGIVQVPSDTIVTDAKGQAEANPDLRDNENVPLPSIPLTWETDVSARFAKPEYRTEIGRAHV